MAIKIWLRITSFALIAISLAGCPSEANFELAAESRLPKWFSIPEGESRKDYQVTMDYYIHPGERIAVFKLFKNGQMFRLAKVTGVLRDPTQHVENRPTGYPAGYPLYEVITVDSVTEVIEQRRPEPYFYVSDDPAVRKELGVEIK